MSGLSTRLDEDKSDNLEPNFPSSCKLEVSGQEMNVLIYAFKKGKRQNYSGNEGIVFTVNGQAQGFLPQNFFERKSVGMSYIKDSILVIVDCSKFERRVQEDLFMNSRDRLRDTDVRHEIENQLEELIKNHEGLKALRARRRQEEIEDKLKDSKPLSEILETIIKKSPTLTKLFIQGVGISNPFNITEVETGIEFKGKQFPTYFKLSRDYPQNSPKDAPINRRFRVQFETDAENDYFSRDRYPGQFCIFINNQLVKNYSLNLWNGLATLTVSLPKEVKIGDVLLVRTETTDVSRVEPFCNKFYVRVTKEEGGGGGKGKRKSPPGKDKTGKGRKTPSGLALPNIIELRKENRQWEDCFKDDTDALVVKDTGENAYDFYINIDNKFLQNEIKANHELDPKLLEARFKFGMVLIGLSLLNYYEDNIHKTKDNDFSIYDTISLVSRAVSPCLLPMISSLGNLEIE